jgi:hypothetical protein
MHADSLLIQGTAPPINGLQLGAPAASGSFAQATQAAATTNANRRKSPRYSAVSDRLWLGWWAEDEFMLVEAQLININEGGVLVSVTPSPAPGQHVWMRLTGSVTQESLEAAVLESKWGMLKRRFFVRLAFHQSCPAEFLETAVYGESTAAGSLAPS